MEEEVWGPVNAFRDALAFSDNGILELKTCAFKII